MPILASYESHSAVQNQDKVDVIQLAANLHAQQEARHLEI